MVTLPWPRKPQVSSQEDRHFDVEIAAGQILGGRKNQEDVALARAGLKALRAGTMPVDAKGVTSSAVHFVLCDGMGGHNAGEIAAEAVAASLFRSIDLNGNAPGFRLRDQLDAANETLGHLIAQDAARAGAGTTCIAGVIRGQTLNWVSCGDSPLMIHRGGRSLSRLNQDHSMKPVLREMVRKGLMDANDPDVSRQSSMLRAAVQGAPLAMVDEGISDYQLQHGDTVIAASDGIDTLKPEEVALIVSRGGSAEGVVRKLLRAVEAKKLPHQDNTTLVVIRIRTRRQGRGLIERPLTAATRFVRIAAVSLFSLSKS